MKFLLALLFIVSAQAEGLYLTPIKQKVDDKVMCKQYPVSCAPVSLTQLQQPIAPLMSRKTCVSDEFYYDLIINNEHVWRPIYEVDNTVKKCKQP